MFTYSIHISTKISGATWYNVSYLKIKYSVGPPTQYFPCYLRLDFTNTRTFN